MESLIEDWQIPLKELREKFLNEFLEESMREFREEFLTEFQNQFLEESLTESCRNSKRKPYSDKNQLVYRKPFVYQ